MYSNNNIYKSLNRILLFGIIFYLCQGCASKNITDELVNDKIVVVVLGSSNAFGIGASSPNQSWVGLLKKASSDLIINLSISGSTTYTFLPYNSPNYRNIKPDKLRNIDAAINLLPKIIIFSITTNDIASGYSIDEYLNNMELMTNLCISNKVEYIITSTLPRNPLPFEQRKELYDLNRRLEKTYGNRYVEIYNPVANLQTLNWQEDLCISDLIHPNDSGHLIIFNSIWPIYLDVKIRISKR
jgi:acyl-CoA thioesterase-1